MNACFVKRVLNRRRLARINCVLHEDTPVAHANAQTPY